MRDRAQRVSAGTGRQVEWRLLRTALAVVLLAACATERRRTSRAEIEESLAAAAEKPPRVEGGLTQKHVFDTVDAGKRKLARCTYEQREKEPGRTGKLLLRWTILTSGRVEAVEVLSKELEGTHIATCMAAVIANLTFPEHTAQGEPIVFPLKF